MDRLRLLTSSLVSSCLLLLPGLAGAQCVIPPTVPPSAYTLTTALPYTTHPNAQQTIDLWVPTGVTNPPVLVVIHGGSFIVGNAIGSRVFAEQLATFGIATASINYRLVKNGQNVFPASISDTRCAVRWLQANQAALHIDGSVFAGLGESAGGNLIGLLGTGANPGGTFDATPDCLVPPGAQPRIVAVADYYGLNDIGDASAMNGPQTHISTGYLGVAPQSDVALANQASPITYVSAKTPPFFVARGTADNTMPEAQATNMVAALQAVGVAAQYYDVEEVGHGFRPLDVKDYPQLQPSACALIAFLQAALGVAQ
jgi:acetyl esterase/lipase